MPQPGDRSANKARKLAERLMLAVMAALLDMSERDFTPEAVRVASMGLRAKLAAIVSGADMARDAARDLADETAATLADQLERAGRDASDVSAVALRAVSEAQVNSTGTLVKQLERVPDAMCTDANRRFLDAAGRAAIDVQTGRKSREQAVTDAVRELARQDVSAYTYEDRRGRTFRVPCDVGVRRHIQTVAARMVADEVIAIAKGLGINTVEVSSHAGARPSHAEWQGRIYCIDGQTDEYPNFYAACHVGDLVDGFGGYNCRHLLSVWDEGFTRKWDEDPSDGTGKDNAEWYAIRQRQRALENSIRKDKREVARLDACGLDATDARCRLNAHRAKLRALVADADNPRVVPRERWREQVRGEN